MGYRNLTCIDYSAAVIQQRLAATMGMPGLQFEVMDAAELKFDDGSFECVLDKALPTLLL